MFTPKVDDPLPDEGSAERADAETREDCPNHINRPPLPTPSANIMKAAQPETEHDEGKGSPVVQARFTGQAEA